MDLTEKAKKIISENNYLSLATSLNNQTWISPVWYAHDSKYNFYFVSDFSSRHTTYIKQNPNVAFSIYNSTELPEDVNGVQVEAKGYEVTLKDIPTAITTIFAKKGSDIFKFRFPKWTDPASYSNLSKFRIYKLVPEHFWILDPEVLDTDKRVEVFLK